MKESELSELLSLLNQLVSETKGTDEVLIETADNDMFYYWVDKDEQKSINDVISTISNILNR